MNKIIKADCIDGLDFLKKTDLYDICLIDPPYNENKSKGKYKDIWTGSSNDFSWAGKSHSEYLDFLSKRVSKGRDILSEAGVLLLFIGDKEVHYVRIMLDKIFGEENYIGTLIWDSSSNQQKTKLIDRNHEYVLIYSKNIKEFSKIGFYKEENNSINKAFFDFAQDLKNNKKSFKENLLVYNEFYKKTTKEIKNKSFGKFKYLSPNYIPFYSDNSSDPRNGNKTILLHPITKKPCPLPAGGKGWRYSQDYIDQIKNSKNIYIMPDEKVLVFEPHSKKKDILGLIFGKDETGVPNTCRGYSKKTDKKIMTTTGYSFKGDKKEGISFLTGFETVKPKDLLIELISNYPNKNAKIIDFFAGSGSVAVSVNQLNLIDSGNRSWTLIEENEETIDKILIPKLNYYEIFDFKKIDL